MIEGEREKNSCDERRLKELMTTKPSLRKILEGTLWIESEGEEITTPKKPKGKTQMVLEQLLNKRGPRK